MVSDMVLQDIDITERPEDFSAKEEIEVITPPAGSFDMGAIKDVKQDTIARLYLQIELLLWKRFIEYKASKLEIAKIFLSALLFFTLIILLGLNLLKNLTPCLIEFFIVPFAFWAFFQVIVSVIVP